MQTSRVILAHESRLLRGMLWRAIKKLLAYRSWAR